MPDEKINIIFNAVDEGSSAINGIRGAIMSFNQVMQAAGQIQQTVKQAYNETVGALVTYGAEVKNLQTITGNTAQDTSRLLTITKDYGLTVSELTMAQRTLAKTGESLTTVTLAKMSDQFIALGTGAEKTTFLVKNFGRSGADLATLLDQGSASILKQAAAVNTALVLDDKMVAKTQQLKIQEAQMNDVWQATKIQIGEKLVPVVSNLLTFNTKLNDNVTASKLNWMQYIPILGSVYMGIQDIRNAIPHATASLEVFDKGERDAAVSSSVLGDALGGVGAGAWNLVGTLDTAFQKLMNIIEMGAGYANMDEGKIMADIRKQGAGNIVQPTPSTGTPYWIPDPNNPGHYMHKASGGPFAGWGLIGDAPGGGLTPYSELVYAPGGAQVFKASDTRKMLGYAGGGYVPPPPNSTNYAGGWKAPKQGGGSGWLNPSNIVNYGLPSGSNLTNIYNPYGSSGGGSGAVIQAISGVASASITVASAAATISQSGKATTQATQQAATQAVTGNSAVIQKLTNIESLLQRNFTNQSRQWAAAAAKIRK